MRAMILAAGLGKRMGCLTAQLPKPLLTVGGRYLIDYVISSLKKARIEEIIINVFYRADQIKTTIGDGRRYGVNIIYSEENERLETGGGIVNALPLLGKQPFLVVSSDIITDYAFANLLDHPQGLAHLIMVENPTYHREGDYSLSNGRIGMNGHRKLTYANMGVYRPELFENFPPGYFSLKQVLNPAIQEGHVTGEFYQGEWHNIGTPDDLKSIQQLPLN